MAEGIDIIQYKSSSVNAKTMNYQTQRYQNFKPGDSLYEEFPLFWRHFTNHWSVPSDELQFEAYEAGYVCTALHHLRMG